MAFLIFNEFYKPLIFGAVSAVSAKM